MVLLSIDSMLSENKETIKGASVHPPQGSFHEGTIYLCAVQKMKKTRKNKNIYMHIYVLLCKQNNKIY